MERIEVYKIVVGGRQHGWAHKRIESAIEAAQATGVKARVVHCVYESDGVHQHLTEQTVWPETGRITVRGNAGPSWNVDEVLD